MVKLELSTTYCTFLLMVLGMICTLVIDENFEKGLFFVLWMTQKPYFSWNEYNTKIFVARRAPWQKATLTSLGFVRSAKTNFRWNFPLQQIFELIHSALCTWAAAWKFSLSANKREIVPKHYSLPPMILPLVKGWLVRWHNMQIDWKGKVLDHSGSQKVGQVGF